MNKTLKQGITILLIWIIFMALPSFADTSADLIDIRIDGKIIDSNFKALSIDGKNLVPLRKSLELLGLNVSYHSPSKTVSGSKENLIIKIVLGENKAYINDEEVSLEFPSTIIDDNAYIPLSFFARSANFIHKVDETSNFIELYSYEYIYEKNLKIVEEKISFDFDKRLFTLYAFLNYTGYDDENLDVFHPVRKKLRDELNKKNISISNKNYYKERTIKTEKNGVLVEEPLLYSTYVSFIHKTAMKYPSFGMSSIKGIDTVPYNNINDLGQSLNQFYKNADIESIIDKYESYHDDYIGEIESDVYSSLADISIILNISDIKETSINVNLLEAYHRGVSHLEKDGFTGKSSIQVGPSDDLKSTTGTIIHEYLHQYVNPVIDEYNIDDIKLNGELRLPVQGIYSDKRSVVIESIVRVLDTLDDYAIRSDKMEEKIEYLEMQGFIFADETYRLLCEYNFENNNINDFLKDLLIKYTDKNTQLISNQDLKNHPINKLNFKADPKVFTLFAFLNMTGYSEGELTLQGKEIQEHISKMELEGIDFNYYTNRGLGIETYLEALNKMGPAPNFELKGELPKKLDDLDKVLRLFYKSADLESLIGNYKKEYERVASEYIDMSKLKLLIYDHNKYYNIAYDKMEPITIIVELQTPFDFGYIYDNHTLIIGDSEVENNIRNIGSLYKKYALLTINQASKGIEEKAELSNLNVHIPVDTLAYKNNKSNDLKYVKENLMYAVRASMIYRDFPGAYSYEYKERIDEGYTMVQAMVNRIQELRENNSYENIIEIILKDVLNGNIK